MVNKFARLSSCLFLGMNLLLALHSSAQSNFILPYQDFRNYLYAFENGTSRQLESQPVRTFAGKGPNIAYINTANDIYLYFNGEKNKLGDATGINYDFTNQLFYYRLNDALTIFDNGKLNTLSFFLLDFKIIDGIVLQIINSEKVLMYLPTFKCILSCKSINPLELYITVKCKIYIFERESDYKKKIQLCIM